MQGFKLGIVVSPYINIFAWCNGCRINGVVTDERYLCNKAFSVKENACFLMLKRPLCGILPHKGRLLLNCINT